MFRLAPVADPLGKSSRREIGAELFVMNDPPQGQKKLAVGPVSQSAAAQDPGLPKRSASLVHHHRSADREGLQDHVAEGLGKERRNHHRPGAPEEPGQRRTAQQALEVNVGQISGQRAGAARSARSRRSGGPPPADTSSRESAAGIPFIVTSRPAAAR